MEELLNTLESAGLALGVAVAGVFDSAGLRGASEDELLAVLRVAGALGRRVEGLLVEATGEVAERSSSPDRSARLTTRVQCRNVNEVVTRTTRVSGRRATELERAAADVRHATSVSSGELLPPRFPALRDALGEGEVGVDGIRAATGPLHDAAARLGTDARLAADEQLAAMARGEGPEGAPPAGADDLQMYAQALAIYLDPDGAEPRADRAMMRRGVTLGRGRDGLVTITGRLLPEVAAQFQRIVDSVLNPRVPEFVPTSATTGHPPSAASGAATGAPPRAGTRHADTADTADTATDDPGGVAADVATDATADVAANVPAGAPAASDRAGPEWRAQRPDASDGAGPDWRAGPDASEIDVPMDLSAPPWGPPDRRSPAQKRHDAFATALVAAAGSGHLPTLGGDAPTLVVVVRQTDLDTGRGAAHVTEHDQPVSLTAARHVACSGRVERVTMDTHGAIVNLHSDDRVFTKRQRHAIATRDGGCIIPGCTVPANWCEIHHVQEWANDGPTHPDNGVLLCWLHHRTLDDTGWQIRMTNGIPEVQAPTRWDPTHTWRPATKSPARLANLLEDQRYAWTQPAKPPARSGEPAERTETTEPVARAEPPEPAEPAKYSQPADDEPPQAADPPPSPQSDPPPWGQPAKTPAAPRGTGQPARNRPTNPPTSPAADTRPWGQPARTPAAPRGTDQPARTRPTNPPANPPPSSPADPPPWGQPAQPPARDDNLECRTHDETRLITAPDAAYRDDRTR